MEHQRMGGLRPSLLVLVFALTVLLGSPAYGHTPADGVQADHAYAGDPLVPMTTAANLFPGHSPDGQTGMASTTKVMSLIITLEAVRNGVVSMNDVVTVSFAASAQPPNSSMMVDDLGALLAVGEVMSLEDLVLGMMLVSGNNATVAIAEHVAKGYLGSVGTVAYFVGLMNAKAAALGLASTIYSNPVGYEHLGLHVTSARDLARLWNAGMADSEFRRIVHPDVCNVFPPGQRCAWQAIGTAGTTTKTYTMRRATGYPGLEGHKPGGNISCSGDQDECFVASARRIGRRVIVAGMQADGSVGGTTGDAAEMFDAAFNRLFHPDPRGVSPLGSAASRHSLVCPTTNRAVSASIPSVGRTRLTSWNTNVQTQTYSVAGSVTAPTGSLATTTASQPRDVDAIALSATRVVTATTVGTSVELRLWNVPASGAPTTVGAAVGTRTTGLARSFELVRLSSTMFASAARSTGDQLVLKTWRSTETGLDLLQSFTSTITVGVTEVDVASAPGQQALRFVTVVRRTNGQPLIQSWEVTATTGVLSGDPSQPLTEGGSGLSIVPAPVEALPDEVIVDKFYAIGYRRANGGLGLVYTRVKSNGELGSLSAIVTGGGISAIELAPFGTSGIVSLTRLTAGTLKPIVWETRRNANGSVTGRRISDHATTHSGAEPEICATATTKAEGDFIAGSRDGLGGIIRLRGWRVGDRP